jgi:hypothetical protein
MAAHSHGRSSGTITDSPIKKLSTDMKTTHTSGPWYVGGFPDGDYDVTDDDGGNTLASGIIKIEDARLIAAAPDLLEALKYCVSVFEAQLDHNESYYKQAIEAIKKAN